MASKDILRNLDQVLQERKSATPADSYVANLYAGGNRRIADKILEEAEELIAAADGKDRDHIIHETADLWFHCLVLLASKNIASKAILEELAKRFGVSGHQEKRQRGK